MNIIDEEIENFEIFYIIWFGNVINQELQQQLRIIINNLLIFEDENECLKFFHSLSKNDRIILILKDKLAQKLISQIISFQQIISIYIYSNEKKPNEQWIKNFKKIKGIFTRCNELIQQIQIDYIERQFYKIDEPFSYNIFNPRQLTNNLNEQYFNSQILIDCLINIKLFSNEKINFINFCKNQYKNNPYQLNIINEFEKDYSSDKALWWYTRSTFIYRLLNKAFKNQNINLLILLHFFIHDIKQQMKNFKCLSFIRVYRGQLMLKNELEYLTKFIGNFILINKFFSTSFNREKIRTYISSLILIDNMEKVIFEINANPYIDDKNFFSNITSLSYYKNFEEILFMIGSIFRLVHIERDIDGIWNIQLILCSNKDHQLQTILEEKKTQLNIIDSDIFSLGFLLENMKKFDEAEKYYYYILNQLPNDHEDLSRCYHALGEIVQKKGDYDLSLEWYNKSIEIDIKMSKIDDSNLAISYNSIAVIYTKQRNFSRALEFYKKSLDILEKKCFNKDHLDIAMCYNNIGIVYQEEENYFEALEYYHKAWNIRQKYLSIDHTYIGQSHACIGNIHYRLNHYDLALEHYNLSLEIFKKSLSINYFDIALILRNIGFVYQRKNEFQQALIYLEKSLTIYRQLFSLTHPDIIQIEQVIQHISLQK